MLKVICNINKILQNILLQKLTNFMHTIVDTIEIGIDKIIYLRKCKRKEHAEYAYFYSERDYIILFKFLNMYLELTFIHELYLNLLINIIDCYDRK